MRQIDMSNMDGVDDWIARLERAGHFLSCSSGATGKSAMLIASQKDMDWSRIDTVNMFAWGSGVKPARDRMMIGCAPKNNVIADAQYAAYANPAWERFRYPTPPITVGSLTKMVVLRKVIADGVANRHGRHLDVGP